MKAMKTLTKPQKGASLVEVLVAVIVFAIGLLAIAALQGKLVRGGADAKTRTVAANLAEQQLEQFRSFTTSAQYTSISPLSQGSAITDTVSGVQYSVWWDVDDYHFPDSGGAAVLGADAAGNSDFKMVRIHVGWSEPGTGTTKQALLEDIVGNSPPSDTLLSVSSKAPPESPIVRYKDLLTAPDVIQVNLGDDTSKQTSKPEPEIEGEGPNVVTRFDAVTFTNQELSGFPEEVRREEFLNINCRCTESTDEGPALTPASWNGYEWKPGDTVTKRIGEPLAGLDQPFVCDRCCRDHHDTSGQPSYDPFRPSGNDPNGNPYFPADLGGDHGHFIFGTGDTQGQLVPADAGGSEYLEACSLVRVNGIYQATTDFNLESLVVLPIQYLQTETGVANYAAYVEQFVKDYVSQLTDQYPQQRPNLDLNDPNNTASPELQALWDNFPQSVAPPTSGDTEGQPMLARGIYINYMNDELLARLACREGAGTGCSDLAPSEDTGPVLPLVPFQDINVTRLATWGVDDAGSSSIFVTQDSLTASNADTYDRGRALHCAQYTPTDGSATVEARCDSNDANVMASIFRSNTGLLSNANPVDAEDATLTQDSILIDFDLPPEPPTRSVKGQFSIGRPVQGVEASNISVAGSSGIFCTRPEPSKYTCVFSSGTDSGTITIGNYNSVDRLGNVNNYVACPTGAIFNDGTTIVTGLDPVGDGTAGETTSFDLTAMPNSAFTLDIQIKKNGC